MANTIHITGGRPLYGTVRVPAAKNSLLPLLAATVLCTRPVRLRSVPRLADGAACCAILRQLGMQAVRDGQDLVVYGAPGAGRLPPQQAVRLRASILFAAPLLARLGYARTVLPGGCRIGARPVDMHLRLLAAMGAQVCCQGQTLALAAPHGLHGVRHTLPFPSVGATETALLAACCARGHTVLHGAACEPEIADLARFLNRCGAQIEGAGGPVVHIRGRGGVLGGCSYRPMPDRIVASTLACAVACAGGKVRLAGCRAGHLAPLLAALRAAGCSVQAGPHGITVARTGRLWGIGRVFTGPYPALATDAAPLLAAALLAAGGESCIEDIVFENRFACAAGFAAMGANVRTEGRRLHIAPAAGALHGAAVQAADLRGGAALVLAALGAKGHTTVGGAQYIARGYPQLGRMLAGLGARVYT